MSNDTFGLLVISSQIQAAVAMVLHIHGEDWFAGVFFALALVSFGTGVVHG